MNVQELKSVLAQHPDAHLQFELPNGQRVPAHAHVTEVARFDKRFVDCGGTRRNDARCQLQTWVANDLDHRLTAGKLLAILQKAQPLLESDELPVDVEHEVEWTSQFPLESAELIGGTLIFHLGVRHTACLAEDKCLPKPSVMNIDFGKLPKFTPPDAGCCS
jgi:hypothetical protein